MKQYLNLPEDIQNNIDSCVKINVKNITRHELFVDLEQFHKQRLRSQIFDYYNEWKKKHNLFVTYDMIETDILMWLNHPLTLNMDTPFMNGINPKRFGLIIKRAFPFSSNITNELHYKLATKDLSKKQLINKIFNILTIYDLEHFFTYILRWVGKCTQKHIIQISLGKYNYL